MACLSLLLLLSIAVACAQHLRPEPTVAVFYNLAMMNDWKTIAHSQMMQLSDSGILAASSLLSISALGNSSDFLLDTLDLPQLMQENSNLKLSVHTDLAFDRHEYPTLQRLQQYCQDMEEAEADDALVLYLHSKGVNSAPGSMRQKLAHNWREYMQYFVLWQWKDCANALLYEHVDVCGVDYHDASRDNVGFPHFSGNIWWSTCEYIRRQKRSPLGPASQHLRSRIGNPGWFMPPSRPYAEAWLLDQERDEKPAVIRNCYDAHTNFYDKGFDINRVIGLDCKTNRG
jgi:hypothetical protein